MFVLRNQPKGARIASFGLGLCVFALMPTRSDIRILPHCWPAEPGGGGALAEAGVLLCRHHSGHVLSASEASDRELPRRRPRPIGLASLDHQGIDITGSVTGDPLVAPPPAISCRRLPRRSIARWKGLLLAATETAVALSNVAGVPRTEPSTSLQSVSEAIHLTA